MASDLVERLRGMDTYGYQSQLAVQAADRITQQDAVIAGLVEALEGMLDVCTDEHDKWCSIGPCYNCTCDIKPAKDAARQALAKSQGEP